MTERIRHSRHLHARTDLRRAARSRLRRMGRAGGQGALVRRTGELEARRLSSWTSRSAGASASPVALPGGPIHHYDAIYQDIVPNERIIYGYDMHLDDKRISVSLATVEFKPAGKGTRLTFTEQVPSSTALTIQRCANAERSTSWAISGRS